MLRWVRRHMVAKIFLGVATVLGLAFFLFSMRVGRQIETSMQTVAQDSAMQMATMVRSSIEQAMLSGNGIKVKSLVAELKHSVTDLDTEIHIYDPMGIEVFAPKPPPPNSEEIDRDIAKVLKTQVRVMGDERIIRPIPMEARCSRSGCHDSSDKSRGVLSFEINHQRCSEDRSEVLSKIISSAFIHMMTARQSQHLDEYFSDIVKMTPSVLGVSVYDIEGDPSFGDDMEEFGISQEMVLKTMAGLVPASQSTKTAEIKILPLKKEARCVECHEQKEEMRGALILALAPVSDPTRCDAVTLEQLVDTSLRHIMTSELGRMIALFLDSVVQSGGVNELILYDNEGRIYWNTSHPPPAPHISAALKSRTSSIALLGTGMDQRVRVVEPLRNSGRCSRCHGEDMQLRGLVEVSLSTRSADQAKSASKEIVIFATILTIIGLLLLLAVILHTLVLRPVRQISGITDSIGKGQLDVEVELASENGDEIARLGHRINKMVRDLRTKLNLEKFVSKRTAEAAQTGGVGVTAQGGQRTQATILFSDIRGFTQYSENTSAEKVVAMLNRLLKAQTDVVIKYHGDVDKFVGDELMAIFQGPKAEANAADCALAMLEAVHLVRETSLTVGIGISSGEVIIGAIGHEDRLDFTAIGDVVNTGARLCSAAERDEILVSDIVRKKAQASEECQCSFEEVAPISVKGKSEPLLVAKVVAGKPSPSSANP